ncbi:MAG: MBL fold metallo-hydrolase [Candidatus Omnitrophica bacterium]|nr:MBL fold metallo-hydrolase [Candidatus Omnitrophota bacterium]
MISTSRIDKKDPMKASIRFVTACLILTFFCRPVLASDGLMTIHFVDVGYGDAIFIELPDGENVLIDAGQSEHAGCLIKYLDARNIESLETVILTHPHEDHFGGLASLIEKRSVGTFYINGDAERAQEGYDDLIRTIEGRRVSTTVLEEGDELVLGGKEVRFLVLHPSALDGTANENALVFLIVFKEISILLTSDIQAAQQDELLRCYPQIQSANVIQVPHHGGIITDQFAEAFGNDPVFIVSTGANEYGKPLVEQLDKLKGKVYRTDLHGSVVLQSDGHQIEVINERY